jgi:prepilin-type N-terminal cleavage/methylation domain-containing protein
MSIRYMNSFLDRLIRKERHCDRSFNSRQQVRTKNSKGFTLTELLVVTIIGGLLISGLMGLVIELLTTDARETARTETEQEMNMAIDYIARDIREAIYVYDGACLAAVDVPEKTEGAAEKCAGLFKGKVIPPDNSTPILAFWRLEDLPDQLNDGGSDDDGISYIAGRTYTLVIYFLTKNQPNEPWKGKARIQRYALKQYDSSGAINFKAEDFEPSRKVGFLSWPKNPDDGSELTAGQSIDAKSAVTLIDFVDSRGINDPDLQKSLGGKSIQIDCDEGYVLTPSKATLPGEKGDVRNFYACVKVPVELSPETTSETTGEFNQKVLLFLRGNASGKPGIKTANEGFMPAIETQVLNRSNRDKVPAQ